MFSRILRALTVGLPTPNPVNSGILLSCGAPSLSVLSDTMMITPPSGYDPPFLP